MNLPDGVLPGDWLLAAWLLFVPLFLHAVWQAPWRSLGNPSRFNAWLGTIVMLMLVGNLKAGIKPCLSLHLLGATLCVAAFGPRLAFIGLCGALLGVTLNGAAGWESFAANALLMAGVGSLVSALLLRFNDLFLPANFFVYIFAVGFFGAAITIASVGSVSSLVMALAGVYDAEYLLSDYLPYAFLLGFAEAWLSGMFLTLFVVYRPEWVSTFDDSRYLHNK